MPESITTNLLIIGAGPFGLAMAAYASHCEISYEIVGRPMGFWKRNMPEGMLLRSACDWHLDPLNVHTIEAYLRTRGQTPAVVEPLSLEFYLGYANWFQEQKHIQPLPLLVEQLDYFASTKTPSCAVMNDGRELHAKSVVVAVGLKYFRHEPADLVRLLPPGRFSHTCDLVNFAELKQRRCLIVGGRQSAFEWTALLNEAGAAAVHVSHRHDSPKFAVADWSWVNPLVDGMLGDPAWFRKLSTAEKEAVSHRLWAEGRLKVEPWLESRVMRDTVTLWPKTQVVSCSELPDKSLLVTLDNGQSMVVDHIILATGYKVGIERVPFLARGNILDSLSLDNGFPVLDESFQSNLPGLFFTSALANQQFGPFFGFTIGTRVSARLIGERIASAAETRT